MSNHKNNFLVGCNITLIICLLAAFAFFCFKSEARINDHLSWDELNYETLARKGIAYNALEKNSLSFIAFFEKSST